MGGGGGGGEEYEKEMCPAAFEVEGWRHNKGSRSNIHVSKPGAYRIKLLTGENSGYFLPEFFPVLKSMAESC